MIGRSAVAPALDENKLGNPTRQSMMATETSNVENQHPPFPMQNFDLSFNVDGSTNSPLNIINTTGFHTMTTSQHQPPVAASESAAYSHSMHMAAQAVSSESSLNSSAQSSGSVSSHVSSQFNSTSPVPAPAGTMAMTAGAHQLLPQQTLSSLPPQHQQLVAPPPQQQVGSNTNNGSLLSYNGKLALVPAPVATNTIIAPNVLTTNATATLLGTTGSSSLYGTSILPPMSIAAATTAITGGSVPEFLYQLTKMLTDNNRDIIEWSTYSGNGRIEVHHPARLESEVLGRYFRHSKYSSFQRQLNYFGFRKIAGKGKMSPCSYVNEAATTDIRSLLLMKRKNSKEKQAELDAAAAKKAALQSGAADGGNRTTTTRTSNKRSNPGDNIQPATVQPMFSGAGALTASVVGVPSSGASVASTASATTLASHASFNTMAANIARNTAPVPNAAAPGVAGCNQAANMGISVNVANAAAAVTANKRAKTSEGRGYTVAIGKGVRHQLNGYLRPSAAPKTNNVASTAATIASASNGSASKSTFGSYLSHPSAQQASAAPAPLQFLDPSELGMSIENSLSQLKNNFAAASATTNNGTASSVAGTTVASESSASAASTSVSSSMNTANNSSSESSSSSTDKSSQQQQQQQPMASALTRRISSTTFLGGMLSRDDSLINLAMLPTLDSSVALSSLGTTTPPVDSATNEYMTGIFARDDTLINLASAVDQPAGGSTAISADPTLGNATAKLDGEGVDTIGLEW